MPYVIYDQFHWGKSDHLEVHCDTWDEALEQYRFYRAAFPTESIGLCDLEKYRRTKPRFFSHRKTPH